MASSPVIQHHWRKLATVWLGLIGATLIGVGMAGASPMPGARVTGTGVLLVAFIKVRLIGVHFMEIGTAPRWLRLMFDFWIGLVAAMLIMLFWISA